MAKLIEVFTFDRNAIKRDSGTSAESVKEHIDLVQAGTMPDKTQSNIVGALTTYMGVFTKGEGGFAVAPVGDAFLSLHKQDPEGAWQWLLTRALYMYVVPNGTACRANEVATASGIRFNFFHLMLAALTHLSALSRSSRFLYYDELCALLADDANWSNQGEAFFTKICDNRGGSGTLVDSTDRRALLEDLEDDFSIPRDNFNGLLNKTFRQTGLFQYTTNGNKPVGIALSDDMDEILQRRWRFMLDFPPSWEGE